MSKKFDEEEKASQGEAINMQRIKKQDSDLASEMSSKLSISDKVPKNVDQIDP